VQDARLGGFDRFPELAYDTNALTALGRVVLIQTLCLPGEIILHGTRGYTECASIWLLFTVQASYCGHPVSIPDNYTQAKEAKEAKGRAHPDSSAIYLRRLTPLQHSMRAA
jgi:hypothetical protein